MSPPGAPEPPPLASPEPPPPSPPPPSPAPTRVAPSGAVLAVLEAAAAAGLAALFLIPGSDAPTLDVERLLPALLGLVATLVFLILPALRAGAPGATATGTLREGLVLIAVALPALIVAAFFAATDAMGLARALAVLIAEAALAALAVAAATRVRAPLIVGAVAALALGAPLLRFAVADAFGHDLGFLTQASPLEAPAAVAVPATRAGYSSAAPPDLPRQSARILSPTDGCYRPGRLVPIRVVAPIGRDAVFVESAGMRYCVTGLTSDVMGIGGRWRSTVILHAVFHGTAPPRGLLAAPGPRASPTHRLTPETPIEWRATPERDVLVAVASGSKDAARAALGPAPVLALVDLAGLALADLEAFDVLVTDAKELPLARAFAAAGGLVIGPELGGAGRAGVERIAETRRLRAAAALVSDPAVDPYLYEAFEPATWPHARRRGLARAAALAFLAIIVAAFLPGRVRRFAPGIAGLAAAAGVAVFALPASRVVTASREIYRVHAGGTVAARETWLEVSSPAAARELVTVTLEGDAPAKAILYDLPRGARDAGPAPSAPAVVLGPEGLRLVDIPVGAGERRIFVRTEPVELAGPLDAAETPQGLRIVNRSGRSFTGGFVLGRRSVVPLEPLADGDTRAIAPDAPGLSFVEYGIGLEARGRPGRERKAALTRLLRSIDLRRGRVLCLFEQDAIWLVQVRP